VKRCKRKSCSAKKGRGKLPYCQPHTFSVAQRRAIAQWYREKEEFAYWAACEAAAEAADACR
jgi:hypothetical protein